MHRYFRELLDDARGEHAFVLAVNLDIRGFSAWSRHVESPEATLYLSKLYPKLIDEYFDDWFFKPTGDGLLLVRAFEEPELKTLVPSTLRSCLQIVEIFPSLMETEPMINFQTPQNVGIGIAQGAAARLVSGDRTLDYSGRVLNLASRLMELARPRGVVFDDGFGKTHIPEELSARFASQTGYIRGVSPDEPVVVHYLPEVTEIPKSFERKPDDIEWGSAQKTFTLSELREIGTQSRWRFELESICSDPDQIKVTLSHPGVGSGGKKMTDRTTNHTIEFQHSEHAGQHQVTVSVEALIELLTNKGVRGPWPVVVKVDYPVAI